ncbi:hypothetical protein GDO81_005402 [Engystomops pustulosus]|uniref:Uncharacterized protein n=1 Tax=Engystomops pustulosus TaxID=76066 RepID=A0AAV7CN58_ENGPU|nr:hypothetical protein GDO81_005402 [Engystomops pustulosus]
MKSGNELVFSENVMRSNELTRTYVWKGQVFTDIETEHFYFKQKIPHDRTAEIMISRGFDGGAGVLPAPVHFLWPANI